MTGGKYKFLTNQERPSYLNKLIGQNIIFLASEVGIDLEDNIYTKVKVSSLFPKPIDENKWGAFMGEFKTNFILPNYIGIGNGITRGFGTIYGMFNPETFSFDKEALIEDANDQESEPLDSQDDLESISASEVPKPKRNSKKSKRRTTRYNKNRQSQKFNKKKKRKNSSNRKNTNFHSTDSNNKSKRRHIRHRHVLAEEFDIEEDNSTNNNRHDNSDDDKFNTEKHHKKQHKF